MAKRKKLMITGAAGKIGSALRKHLRDRYDFRLLFHSRIPEDLDRRDEVVISDVSNFASMLEATEGVDAIAHLALARGWRGVTQAQRAQMTFDIDMQGNYNFYEAARINGVGTVVFASTNHVSGMNEKAGIYTDPDMPVRPDSIYGAGKAFGEALGRLYSDRNNMRVICIRIASFNGEDEPGRYYENGLSRWLSPRDMAQLTWRGIEAEGVKFGIFYGVSGGAEKKWDLTNAKELLGYEPEDDGTLPVYQEKYRKEG